MKIIELFVDPDSIDGGCDGIALVDRPAHESNWLTFSQDEILDVPQFNYTYVCDVLSEIEQDEFVNLISELGEPAGKLEAEGWVIQSIEVVRSMKDILNNFKEVFAAPYEIISTPNQTSKLDRQDKRVRYKYVGPKDNKNRKFCAAMLERNRVFRFEDIAQMTEEETNREFGYYDIFTWRGSYNCRHDWVQVTYTQPGPITANKRAEEIGSPDWSQPSTKVNFNDELIRDEFGILAVIDGQPLFTEIDDALKMAELLGCEGYHEHKVGDYVGYMACYTHEFQSFDDYPEAAVQNACKVLKWIDEHGRDEVDGMERTGLARANQLCNREPISVDTIARMASFERHRKNSELSPEFRGTPWKDRGYVAWLGWGGDEGIAYAQKKLEQIRQEMDLSKACWPNYEAIGLKDDGTPNCVPKQKMGSLSGVGGGSGCGCYADKDTSLDIFGYKTKYFQICPGAINLFQNLIKMDGIPQDDYGMIRSAAGIADNIFKIEYDVINRGSSTYDEVEEAVVLLDDFKDVMGEIKKDIPQLEMDLSFMNNHIVKIASLLNKDEMEIQVEGKPYIKEVSGVTSESVEFKYGFSYDEEKMEITGAAVIPNKMIIRRNPITEELYYVFFSRETTKILAEKFLANGFTDSTNLNHTDIPAKDTFVVESWIVEDPKLDKSTFLGLDYPVGTWVITMKVKNKELWEKIKKGEYKGFSIEGYFNEKVVFN
jgi:hypothetical protein